MPQPFHVSVLASIPMPAFTQGFPCSFLRRLAGGLVEASAAKAIH
jgi:hypothetical protein